MRDIRPECCAITGPRAAGYKESVGPGDGDLGCLIQVPEGIDDSGCGRGRFSSRVTREGPQLDVLRTVTEALVDCNNDALRVAAQDATIHTIAPACR
jgi:hypothetical protein